MKRQTLMEHEDSRQILSLYEARDEKAIARSIEKYGAYCFTIANGILADENEAQECVNDTWLKAWQTIPPQKPQSLRLYLAKIIRNLAFNRYKEKTRAKRGGTETDMILDELSEIIAGNEDVEEELIVREVKKAIERFLLTIPRRDAEIFICRYFYAQPQKQIARQFDLRENHVRTILLRTRNALRSFLEKESLI